MQIMKRALSSRTSRSARVPHARPQSLRLAPVQAVQKPAIAQFADNIGLPTDEGLFGFKPFSEVWCGRLAMMGFVTSIVVEAQTGLGTLQQIGVAPSDTVLAFMAAALVAGTLTGSAITAYRGLSGKMSSAEAERYKQFLLLDREEALIAESRKQGSVADQILSATSTQAIDAARREGMPADKFLADDSTIDIAAAKADGSAADAVLGLSSTEQPSTSGKAAVERSYDEVVFSNSELRYAREVELSNGRSAMIGFLAAVLVEAATGKGIIMQLIMWGKISGLLGYESGF